MKKLFIIITTTISCLFSANAMANVILDAGEVYTAVKDQTVICTSNHPKASCENARVLCLDEDYGPTSCKELSKCNQGQTECLEQGYTPSSCKIMKDSEVQVRCLQKGYGPSSCAQIN